MTSDIAEKTPAAMNSVQPEWLRKKRQEAWKRYCEMPLPESLNELWKYTKPGQFLYRDNGAAGIDSPITEAVIAETLNDDFSNGSISGYILNNSGKNIATRLRPELESAGVLTGSLAEFAEKRPDLVRQRLGKLVGMDFGKFEALNFASWQNGILIYIPKGIVITKPLYAVTNVQPNGHCTLRNIIVIEETAAMDLFEIVAGGAQTDSGQSVNIITETFSGKASRFNHVTAHTMNEGTRQHFTHRSRVDRDAQVKTVLASLGSVVSKVNFGTELAGTGAQSEMKGIVIADNRQHFDHFSLQEHSAPNSYSSMEFRSALNGRSRSSFRGRISITSAAPFSEAYQENKNLVLSPNARAESTPELEISQDEVICSHGATIGPPDEEELFYLTSRGIPKADAVRLISEGFFENLLKDIPEQLKLRLRNYLAGYLRKN